jgi:hypothetical protein
MQNHFFSALAILLITNYFLPTTCIAQAPQGIPYQAIARNAIGQPIANTAVKVRFTIRDSIATGAIKYQETHNPTTSALGLFSVNVGMGTAVSGTFSGINWGKNAKFLQVELNTTGGTTYTDLGTTQMMSVPYALYAENSGSINSTSIYQSRPTSYSLPSASNMGFYEAVNYCFNLTEGGYSDWRMPSIPEVEYLRDVLGQWPTTGDYWTKTIDIQSGGNRIAVTWSYSTNYSALRAAGGEAPYYPNNSVPAICVR